MVKDQRIGWSYPGTLEEIRCIRLIVSLVVMFNCFLLILADELQSMNLMSAPHIYTDGETVSCLPSTDLSVQLASGVGSTPAQCILFLIDPTCH